MTDESWIRLEGDKDVRAAFRDLKDFLPKQALRTAVRKAAELLLDFIVLAAPKRTGRLARNIAVKTSRTDGTVHGRVIVNTRGKRGDPENAFYWRFLEKGWHTRAGGLHRFPFIAGAFEAKNREAAQEVINSVDDAIDRAERRAKRAGVAS
jgi:HK97 gp10 family phage protein